MSSINSNGKILPVKTPIFKASNRGLKYGDGLFETMRSLNGHIPFARDHFRRLVQGMKVLSINVPKTFSFSFFQKEILKLTKNEHSRVRFSIYRSEGGLYLPKGKTFHFVIEASPLKKPLFELNAKGLHLGLTKKVQLSYDSLSPIKSIAALPYIIAATDRQKQKVDDVLILNTKGRIAEANSSNLFVWTGRRLKTPALTEACIAGVIRKQILGKANKLGLKVTETKVTLNDLKKARSIFLTNSIQGIRWVNRFENSIFEPTIGNSLINLLNDLSKK